MYCTWCQGLDCHSGLTQMDSITPFSKYLSFLAKMFTLLSSREWFFSFRCKWTSECGPEELALLCFSMCLCVQICAVLTALNNINFINLLLLTPGCFVFRMDQLPTAKHSELPWSPWLRTFNNISENIFLYTAYNMQCFTLFSTIVMYVIYSEGIFTIKMILVTTIWLTYFRTHL